MKFLCLLLLCVSAQAQPQPQPQLKISIRESGCSDPTSCYDASDPTSCVANDSRTCEARAYTVKKSGKLVNWILTCNAENATCQRLRPFTTYAFDIVDHPIPECRNPHAHPQERACIVIHGRPSDLNYTAITLQAVCGSNTKDCLTGMVYPDEITPESKEKPPANR